jgi:hypothetical protein
MARVRRLRIGGAAVLAAGWIAAAATGGVPAAAAEPIGVEVINRSVATECAEEDNVSYQFRADRIAGYTISVASPAYLGQVVRDITAPDFSKCPWYTPPPPSPYAKPYNPPTAVLWEDEQYIVKGVVYPDFWRPTVVPVKVRTVNQNFLHLVQVWKKVAGGGALEFLVMYPQDGYWRLKPLPPYRMHEVTYGSSFLIGPVEESTRPFVAYKAVEFDPETLTFTLDFAKGGKGFVKLTDLDVGHAAVRVSYDPPLGGALPFAGLRSMYAGPLHADTAEAIWRRVPGGPAEKASVIDFKTGRAAEITFGRSVVSTHNTSAPDMTYGAFSATQ